MKKSRLRGNIRYFLQKNTSLKLKLAFDKVGMTRFELAASSSRTKRATGLRYIPNRFALQNYTFF